MRKEPSKIFKNPGNHIGRNENTNERNRDAKEFVEEPRPTWTKLLLSKRDLTKPRQHNIRLFDHEKPHDHDREPKRYANKRRHSPYSITAAVPLFHVRR